MKTKICLLSALLVLNAPLLQAQVKYTVSCTREGLVGGTTANGHVIVSNDHFCALPSRSVLNSNGGTTYTVNLRNPANGATALNVPVWDVGPWNTNDTYWASQRTYFSDLARGMPEAQAAYETGYNGGKDQKGRTILNRSAIDLGDGTFYDLGSPSQVEVTFNWTTGVIVDNSAAGFTASTSWISGTSSTDKYGADYRYRSTAALSDAAGWAATLSAGNKYLVAARWTQGGNRSTTAPYVVYHSAGSTTVNVNQQGSGGSWVQLGSGTFNLVGGGNSVKLSCWTTTGYIVVADAVKWY